MRVDSIQSVPIQTDGAPFSSWVREAFKNVLADFFLNGKSFCQKTLSGKGGHPALKREDRLGKDPFAGFGTVVEDITESGYTKNQPILLGPF